MFILKFYQETIHVCWQAGSLHSILSDARRRNRAKPISGSSFSEGNPSSISPHDAGSCNAILIPWKWAGRMHSSCSHWGSTAKTCEWEQLPTYCGSQVSCRLSTFHPQKWHRNPLVTTFTQYFPLHQWISKSDPTLEITLSFSSRKWPNETFQTRGSGDIYFQKCPTFNSYEILW